jgi:Bacterial Ig-like domain
MPTGNKNPRRMSKMGKMRILKTLAVMAVMLCGAAVPAMAQSELDQSQTVVNQFWATSEPDKQTFTAQKTGTLDKVSVYVGCPTIRCEQDLNQFTVTLEIGGTQSAPEVREFNLDDRFGRWYDVPLDHPPFVEAGKQYEIRLDSPASHSTYDVRFGGATSDVYPGGEFSAWNGATWVTHDGFKDLAFQTYVTPDTTAPKVDVVNPPEDPAQGTEGVARNTNVTATFSEKMDPDTLSTSTFKLFKVNQNGATSRITPAPVRLSEDGLTARLNPFGSSDTRLNKSTKYKAVVTTGATDVAGNALDQDDARAGNQQKVWYFTTGTT